MNLRTLSILVSIIFLSVLHISAQKQTEPVKVIEFSGIVFEEDKNGTPIPLPYTNVAVKGTSRGASADNNGFFSFVALAGETIVFSRIGYKTIEVIVPDTLNSEKYKWMQPMSEDNILLPEAVIFPWPSKEHLRQEFLAMDVTDKMQDAVQKNLAEQTIKKLIEITPADAQASTSLYLQQQASAYYYKGQFKPMNILSPIAWIQFFEAWKRGDFKRKKQ